MVQGAGGGFSSPRQRRPEDIRRSAQRAPSLAATRRLKGFAVVSKERTGVARSGAASEGAARCRRKFLRFFPGGFADEKYVAWERGYKWEAHEQWEEALNRAAHRSLLREGEFAEVAARAVRIESRTNLLFSFEKMALRGAVKIGRASCRER